MNRITLETWKRLLNNAFAATNWTPVATNVASAGNFTVIVTNAFNSATPQQFYLLQIQQSPLSGAWQTW